MSNELARRIEGVNAHSLAEHSAIAARLFPRLGADAIAVAGGVASFVGPDSPISYAVGLGMSHPVSADDIARVTEFYRSRGTVPRVDVCPYADPSLLDALRQQGFQLHWFVNVLARPLSPAEEIAAPCANVSVREALPHEAELWTDVVNDGFYDGQPVPEALRQLGLILFHRPTMHAYLAEIDGEIAGGAALFTHEGYAALAATSTRVAFRKRGVHTALIRARLKKALALGCDLAGFFASPGSTSHRNAERHGFRVLYSKAALKKG